MCLVLTVAALVLGGCSINDPTETEFAPNIVNDTQSAATMVYCSGTSTCGKPWRTESIRPGQSTSDSINAGHGNLSVFVVRANGISRCIRLAHYTKAIRRSAATAAACHSPYS
jgi:hypothetical protein